MRGHGSARELPEAGAADHLCSVHDDAAVGPAVRAFLAGGLDRGERLLCVGERAVSALDGAEGLLGDVDGLRADGVLETMTVAEAYAATGALTVDRQHALYAAATQRARADGYRGPRVVAEVTGRAADPGDVAELVRWEHAADESMASGSGCRRRAPTGATSRRPRWVTRSPHTRPPTRRTTSAPGGSSSTRWVSPSPAPSTPSPPTGSPRCWPTPRPGSTPSWTSAISSSSTSRAAGRWRPGRRPSERAASRWEIRRASHLVQRVWHILGLDELAPVAFTGARG